MHEHYHDAACYYGTLCTAGRNTPDGVGVEADQALYWKEVRAAYEFGGEPVWELPENSALYGTETAPVLQGEDRPMQRVPGRKDKTGRYAPSVGSCKSCGDPRAENLIAYADKEGQTEFRCDWCDLWLMMAGIEYEAT